jgi:hypothetical protein
LSFIRVRWCMNIMENIRVLSLFNTKIETNK